MSDRSADAPLTYRAAGVDIERGEEAVERINQAGFEVVVNAGPDEFAPQVRREIELVQRIAKTANIKLE